MPSGHVIDGDQRGDGTQRAENNKSFASTAFDATFSIVFCRGILALSVERSEWSMSDFGAIVASLLKIGLDSFL